MQSWQCPRARTISPSLLNTKFSKLTIYHKKLEMKKIKPKIIFVYMASTILISLTFTVPSQIIEKKKHTSIETLA